jgi:hypothetical protein
MLPASRSHAGLWTCCESRPDPHVAPGLSGTAQMRFLLYSYTCYNRVCIEDLRARSVAGMPCMDVVREFPVVGWHVGRQGWAAPHPRQGRAPSGRDYRHACCLVVSSMHQGRHSRRLPCWSPFAALTRVPQQRSAPVAHRATHGGASSCHRGAGVPCQFPPSTRHSV